MAISYIAAAGTNAIPANPSTTGITVTHGFSLLTGDILVAFVAMGDDDPTAFASSSGGAWTADTTNLYTESATGNDISLGVLWRVVTDSAGEPSTYTFTATSATAQKTMVAQVIQVRGGYVVSPLDGVGAASRGTNDFTPTHANYTTSVDNSLLLIAHAASMTDGTTGKAAGKPSTATALTSPASQYQQDTAATVGFDIFIETAYQTTTGAGTQTITAWTGTPDDAASEWAQATIAIQESPEPYVRGIFFPAVDASDALIHRSLQRRAKWLLAPPQVVTPAPLAPPPVVSLTQLHRSWLTTRAILTAYDETTTPPPTLPEPIIVSTTTVNRRWLTTRSVLSAYDETTTPPPSPPEPPSYPTSPPPPRLGGSSAW